MRFALLFLAACGSSSTFVASAPLEGATEEQELASAPIDAPPSPSCHCPEVTVRCTASEKFHARADRATCALDLPPRACALFGFENDAKARPEAILATTASKELSAEDVFELCSTKHEAHHACDRANDSPCASEVAAYDVTLECLRGFATDANVAHNIEGMTAAREMNACLCDATSCSTCAARCRSDHPLFGATCDQAEAVYCR